MSKQREKDESGRLSEGPQPGRPETEGPQPVTPQSERAQPVRPQAAGVQAEGPEAERAHPEGPQFELTGGSLCLDFANTVDSRPTEEPIELLNSYGDLLSWSLQKAVITPEMAEGLREEAESQGLKAAATLRKALALREALFEVFSASARGQAPPSEALDLLNEHLPTALGHLRLGMDHSGYRWEWEEEMALERMLWPVLRSAAELLTSDRLDRVRICSADDCDWLFLDQSKNRSRRWCDMNVCGNRSKVRRFRKARSSASQE